MNPEKNEHCTTRKYDLSEVAIVIDNWDDIFSDFDPRPLIERTVSGDFIEELKKRYRETKVGKYAITLYVPEILKNPNSERMVRQRLKKHFQYLYLVEKKNLQRLRMRGAAFILLGISSLSILTIVTYYAVFQELILELIGIILMPLGWFGIWEGFSKIVDTSPTLLRRRQLFHKLATASYCFRYYAEDTM